MGNEAARIVALGCGGIFVRFRGKARCRYSHAKITVKFSNAMDPSNHKVLSTRYGEDPVVAILVPEEVYSLVKVVGGRKHRE